MKPILRVLHVGVTNRGTWPLERCNESTGFRSAALCDVSEEALAQAREKTGLPADTCFTDYDRALAEAQVDCVIICTPTVMHVPMATKAIEAGLPVLVEKGMAPDWNSARQLARTVRERKAIACVAQNYRYFDTEQTIRQALTDPGHPAHIGAVHLLSYTQNRVRPVPRTLIYPFASVWDMSCHHFDNMMSWFGPIGEMTGFAWGAGWSAYEHANNTAAHIRFANGTTSCHYLHTHDAARNSLDVEIHGERGALVLRDGKLTFNERPLEQFGSRPIVEVERLKSEGESNLLRDFHVYITLGREPGISVRHNLETMAACEMMVRSITDGRTVRREELSA